MLKRIKIRGKILLLLVTPLVAVLVFAFSGVVDRTATSDEKAREARIAEFADASSDLSVALTVERFQTLLASRLMVSATEARPDQLFTDTEFARWQASTAEVLPDLSDPELIDDIEKLESWLARSLTRDRSARFLPESLALDLAAFARTLGDISTALTHEAADLELYQALDNYIQVLGLGEAVSEIALLGGSAVANGEIPITGPVLLDAATSSINNNISDLRNSADPQYMALLEQLQDDEVLPTFVNDSVSRSGWVPSAEIQAAVDEGVVIGAVSWVQASEARLVAINGLSTAILEDASLLAETQSADASAQAAQFLVLAVSVVVFALIMAIFVGRSVSRPLIRLTRDAETLSREELPAMVEAMRNANRANTPVLTPIRARGRDEVAQLARAFSEIQSVTIDVAEEQGDLLRRGISDIFVNLARRNQSLLDRQIDFIDQLENREENPDQLENLFRLDHLATRMRRNAESLLVLAGAEPTRRRGRPVELADVVRVAMGEIEDFSRIELLSVDTGTVAGSVAVDLAHLMSELMENSTQFSPPDTNVEVVGHRSTDGSYQLTLSDRGIGMSAEQIKSANETLENPPIIGLDLSRSLGFTVVSRLAHRLGVRVRLTSSPDGGVTGVITVPADMVGSSGPAPDIEVLPAATEPLAIAAPETPDVTAPVAEAPSTEPPEATEPVWAAEPIVSADPEPAWSPEPAPASEATPAMSTDDLASLPMRKQVAPEPAPEPVAELAPEAPAPRADIFEVFNTPTAAPAPPSDPEADLFAPLDRPDSPWATEPPASPPASTMPGPSDLAPPAPPAPPAMEPVPVPAETVPAADIGTVDATVTGAGLIRRTPKQVEVPDASKFASGQPAPKAAAPVNRSPDEVRQMLSRYRAGLRKGRGPEADNQPNQRS